MVFAFSAFSHVDPVALQFAEMEAGGVGDEDHGKYESHKSEPAYYPKFGVWADLVVQYRRSQGAQLPCGKRSEMVAYEFATEVYEVIEPESHDLICCVC